MAVLPVAVGFDITVGFFVAVGFDITVGFFVAVGFSRRLRHPPGPWGFSPLFLPGTKVPLKAILGLPGRQLKLTVTEERIPLNLRDNRQYMQTSNILCVATGFSGIPRFVVKLLESTSFQGNNLSFHDNRVIVSR